MVNGSYYEGRIVAITADQVLLRQQSNIQSLNRDEIRYVFSDRPQAPAQDKSQGMMSGLEPLDKKYLVELEGGLTMFNPFALKMAYTEWLRLNDRWSVGVGTSFQFFRYSMLNVSGHVRRYSKGTRFVKTFAEAEAAISFYESVTNIQNTYFDYRFHPVKQVGGYVGLWLDTGYKLAFTLKAGVSGTWYKLMEQYTPDYKVEGIYYKGSPVFSCSMLF